MAEASDGNDPEHSPSLRWRIRRACVSDRAAILMCHHALYRDHHAEVVPTALAELAAYKHFTQVLREDVQAMLASPAHIVLLAETLEPHPKERGDLAREPLDSLDRAPLLVRSPLPQAPTLSTNSNEELAPVAYISGRVEHDKRRVHVSRGIIEDWWVHEAWRGRGLGVALLHAISDDFRGEGCSVLESATWPTNHAARRLHERLGFQAYELRYRMPLDEHA